MDALKAAMRYDASISSRLRNVSVSRSTFKGMWDVMLDGKRIARVERQRLMNKGHACWRWVALSAESTTKPISESNGAFNRLGDLYPKSTAATPCHTREEAARAAAVCILSGGVL